MRNIIVIGSRGYRYPYGGWETFVNNLVKNNKDENTHYYIPNLTHEKEKNKKIEILDGVVVPSIYVPNQGFVTMFTFTIKAIQYFIKYIKEYQLKNTVVMILGCKVGPLFPFWIPKLHRLGAKVIINPDGLEWKRDKWAWWIKVCFKISERMSIKYADYCVCDSMAIKDYIDHKYLKYHTPSTFIAYGSYLDIKAYQNKIVDALWNRYHIQNEEYYLIVGRFIPENNYETMIKEFMKSNTNKDLVIVCNLEKNKFYNHLLEVTHFNEDKRIKFIGSVYDKEALIYIRKHAFAYLHGHSAGGTNPSLLEALSMTNVNILFKINYNEEVGEDSCFYFTKSDGSLKEVINKVDALSSQEQLAYGKLAKERIKIKYTWDIVEEKYDKLYHDLLN